ncbi:hypothetical protein CEP51_008302 [Fusarium floridanum]|nr:hypothetical protein CEP51_008302 [Fusarium floridanum]
MNPRLFLRVSPLTRPSIASTASHVRARLYTTKMANRIHRITMFKMPSKDDQAVLLEQYNKLSANQQKDGKPYILSMVVGAADEDARSQGYHFVSKTEFASMEDMKYYDDECKAHNDLKTAVKTLGVQGVLTIYFKPQAIGGVDNA